MLVHAQNLSDAKDTAKTLLHEKNAKIIGVVESKELVEQKSILLCEKVDV